MNKLIGTPIRFGFRFSHVRGINRLTFPTVSLIATQLQSTTRADNADVASFGLPEAATERQSGDASTSEDTDASRQLQRRRPPRNDGQYFDKRYGKLMPRLPTGASCPACATPLIRPEKALLHLRQCCPDLLDSTGKPGLAAARLLAVAALPEAAPGAGTEAAGALAGLFDLEEGNRRTAIRLSFFERDAEGMPIKRTPQEVAELMGLPMDRGARIVKDALRRVPIAPDPSPVSVLFEDDHVIAVSKPAGIRSAPRHRYEGQSMMQRVLSHMGGAAPLVVHRLDEATSGVLLFAKTQQAAANLADQFRSREIFKTYLAVCLGVPTWPLDRTLVDAPIGDDPGRSKVARFVRTEAEGAKAATTECQLIWSNKTAGLEGLSASPAEFMLPSHRVMLPGAPGQGAAEGAAGPAGVCMVRCHPITGRTHQIRVHMQHAGHPLLGDDCYGVKLSLAPRHMLHARSLRFRHPATGQELQVEAPIPEDMTAVLRHFGWAGEE